MENWCIGKDTDPKRNLATRIMAWCETRFTNHEIHRWKAEGRPKGKGVELYPYMYKTYIYKTLGTEIKRYIEWAVAWIEWYIKGGERGHLRRERK